MKLKEREKSILRVLIREYIKEAQPIGSKFLAEKYDLGLSPATIRSDLQRLTEEGYLLQPHTSAGRVPTDRGYRFFINELMDPCSLAHKETGLIKNFLEEKRDESEIDTPYFNRGLARVMSEISKDLVISIDSEEGNVWYEGVMNLFQKPEFQEVNQVKGIFKMIESFKDHLEDFFEEERNIISEPEVFIGKENPFYNSDDYSIIISRCDFPIFLSGVSDQSEGNKASGKKSKKRKDVFAILGPKRMEYNKNISLLEFISKLDYEL